MADLMVPSKLPRAPSFYEKHPHEYSTAGVSDWLPEKEMCHQVQVRNFLELCGFCKKKISQNKDVFMYGYLGAFCSKKCREKQMAFDIFKELHSSQGKSNPKKGRICLTNKPKDHEAETITTPSSSSTSTSTRFFIRFD